MVRANGQRDGVGKTRQLSGAFEHTGAILDPTRVSPYRPAAGDMPQSMRPDTREHLTACTKPSEGQMRRMALATSEAPYLAHGKPAVSSAARLLHSLRPAVTAAADRAGSPGAAGRLASSPGTRGLLARHSLFVDNLESKRLQNGRLRKA